MQVARELLKTQLRRQLWWRVHRFNSLPSSISIKNCNDAMQSIDSVGAKNTELREACLIKIIALTRRD